jgi:sugar lactone lactonase YvrE
MVYTNSPKTRKKMIPKILWNSPCELGEGPMWHPSEKGLYWVDILQKQLHFFDPKLVAIQTYQFDKMPGAVVVTDSHFHLLISFEDGIAKFNTHTQELKYLVKLHENKPNMRANDGKCDPWGNFWVGTMSKTCENEAGALYCLRPDGSFEMKIDKSTISNGLAWDVQKGKMYYIDSMRDSIRSYDFEPKTCTLSNEKTVVHRPDCRYFDGMTIDTEGRLWVAHCTDFCIRRWNPETGEELLKIEMPVPKVTSLTFGGDDYKTLFITTAQEHMTPEEVEKYPLSGSIFSIETDYQGFETSIFKLNN